MGDEGDAQADTKRGRASRDRSGRRQNQLLATIAPCPTFEPTLEEFTEMTFQDYLVECEKLIDPGCGVYKVSQSQPSLCS